MTEKEALEMVRQNGRALRFVPDEVLIAALRRLAEEAKAKGE